MHIIMQMNIQKKAKQEVKEYVERFIPHLKDGCINGIAEIFDGEYASYSRGCCNQAWSVGELYYEIVLK